MKKGIDCSVAVRNIVVYEESEEVADYEYVRYYLDLDSKINMGIKDGVPYYNEKFCDEIPDLL